MKAYAVIVAGGKGLRMGGEVPKQFLPIEGKPILMHTIEAFRKAIEGIGIVLVLPAAQQEYWHELCKTYQFDSPELIANGGETRFQSVKNGLALLPNDAEAVVGIHDGVRPLINEDCITQCIESVKQYGTAITMSPAIETIITVDEKNNVKQTLPRKECRLGRAPQCFYLDQILALHHQAMKL